jgi:formate--tetrahydrofolate ligase
MRPILDVAEELGLHTDDLSPYGRYKAKVALNALDRPRPAGRGDDRPGRLILVSAMTPTPAGEGKTTTTIGLGQALRKLGERACVALREPSLGPCFGVKGGGTGGGACKLEPSADINLHFNGDIHAVTSAHNLLAAVVDNHLHFSNSPPLDPRRIAWKRVLDMNDRALRDTVIGLGGASMGVPRETGFEITAASEIMAILGLASGLDDLRARLDRILIGFGLDKRPVYARDLGVTGALVALLHQALEPNLAQTTDGTPAFVHAGPFANIAHGCNSVLATRMALHHADWVVTEAGFAFDLGGEKFLDIKARQAGLDPACVVVVGTIRALKWHGGATKDELARPNPDQVRAGLVNLAAHLHAVAQFGLEPVVAINQFGTDSAEELQVVTDFCHERGVAVARCDHFARGGEGALTLAEAVMAASERKIAPYQPIYPLDASFEDKIRAIATRIYGADDVVLTAEARSDLKRAERMGLGHLPVCMAKTQSSLSDVPDLRGRPSGFVITVREVQISAGAGFVVVLTGEIMRMPGLPQRPAACDVDVVDGRIVGVG